MPARDSVASRVQHMVQPLVAARAVYVPVLERNDSNVFIEVYRFRVLVIPGVRVLYFSSSFNLVLCCLFIFFSSQ